MTIRQFIKKLFVTIIMIGIFLRASAESLLESTGGGIEGWLYIDLQGYCDDYICSTCDSVLGR